MASKEEIAAAIIKEMIAAQHRDFERVEGSPLPALLWVGDGRSFKASKLVYELVHQYARLSAATLDISTVLTQTEIADSVGRAVALLFDELGQKRALELKSGERAALLDDYLNKLLTERRASRTYHFGCELFHAEAGSEILLGPVRVESRERWISRLRNTGTVSDVTARRVLAAWSGKKPRPRVPSRMHHEQSILDAIGASTSVCTVCTGYQSDKAAAPKALLSARLAQAAVALMWERPSLVLCDMRIAHDGPLRRRRHLASTATGGFASSSSLSGSPWGVYFPEDAQTRWESFRNLLGPISEALALFVDPLRATDKAKLLKGLFMALWWFHEGCRNESDLLAISQFASSLDTLTAGGRASGIKTLIHNRLGCEPDQAWFKDGSTPADLVKEIYETTRNQVVHGSIKDFDRDWSGTRARAEIVARHCLVASLSWLREHPETVDMKALSKP